MPSKITIHRSSNLAVGDRLVIGGEYPSRWQWELLFFGYFEVTITIGRRWRGHKIIAIDDTTVTIK